MNRNLNAFKTVHYAILTLNVSLDVAVMVFVKKNAGMSLVGHNLSHQQAHQHGEVSSITAMWLMTLKL